MQCALHCALARKRGVDSTVEWLRVRQCLSAGAQRSATCDCQSQATSSCGIIACLICCSVASSWTFLSVARRQLPVSDRPRFGSVVSSSPKPNFGLLPRVCHAQRELLLGTAVHLLTGGLPCSSFYCVLLKAGSTWALDCTTVHVIKL